MQARAEALLRRMLGPAARFRSGQFEAIEALVAHRARVLVVQRTGWGKSLVYFIAARLLRESGSGPALLVSPLLSLMRNQIAAAQPIGIHAVRMDSENADEWHALEASLRGDVVDVLIVSPERLANERFLTSTIPAISRGVGMLVVDEAHCISDWGHDFRPDYRRIARIVQGLPRGTPMLATTATANDRVVADVQAQIGASLQVIRGPLARESLRIQTIRLVDQAERLTWLAMHMPSLPGTGIIYCLTTADCDRVSEWLRTQGIDAPAYHAQLEEDGLRETLEQKLLRNEVKALVATVALGMGFDKPDLGFVIHFQRPGSLVAYYQQIGRAGRALAEGHAILLNGREDDEIQQFFIDSAFPPPDRLREVLEAIDNSDGITATGLQRVVNLQARKLTQCLKLLEVEGAIYRDGSSYHRSAMAWAFDSQRAEQLARHRSQELEEMRAFVDSPTCLMERVSAALDDPHAQRCGRCAVCAGDFVPRTVDGRRVQEAVVFLRRAYRPIAPRKQWPFKHLLGRQTRIAADRQVQGGYALCMWGDAGWGQLVAKGKYVDRRFADELVEACRALVEEHWRPLPAPEWVTAVPSLREPGLVADFAVRLASVLGLPFVDALEKARDTPPQKTMENSPQQAMNVAGAIRATPGVVRSGPVLLIDDMVDSGWTLTECGFVLQEAGSGVVYPLALATTAGAGGAQ